MKNAKLVIIATEEVVFPYECGKLRVTEENDIIAIQRAVAEGEKIILVPVPIGGKAKDGDVGIITEVEQFIYVPEDNEGAILMYKTGTRRIYVHEIESDGIVSIASIASCPFYNNGDEYTLRTYFERAQELFRNLSTILKGINGQAIRLEYDSIDTDIDAIVIWLKTADKYLFFTTLDTETRLKEFCKALDMEVYAMGLDVQVSQKVRDSMDQSQREYYIREQIRALSDELGDEDEEGAYLAKIDALNTTEANKEKFRREVRRLKRTAPASPDMALIKNYLDTIIELPWGVYTEDNDDLKTAQKVLDEDHYGIKEVKERLIEALAVRKLSKEGRSPIICLVGPPGIGKTSIAKSIARAMNKKYVRLSFGGVRDEAEIRGHRKTYVGAMPGRIITSIQSAGSMNPIFLMDEIDKMASDYKGDPASALLEVLDPAQNVNFRDHFLEVPFDLSKVLFITTANTLDTISRPLLDRMEVIEMTGYTTPEKMEIALRYIIPRAIEQNGVDPNWLSISKDAVQEIIDYYTREAGVRGLEKQINKVVRKVARIFVEKPRARKVKINKDNIKDFLGEPIVAPSKGAREDEVGIVTGLAWSAVGGDTMDVEVGYSKGKGNLVLTGNLGDVIKESAKIAFSYLRIHCKEYGIMPDFFEKNDIHIHMPEGAVPKDGPSAGITLCTAICSALTGNKVYGNVAMTGELSLRGKVLAIGGLKEKTLAALREGVVKVFLPEDNRKDYKELPDIVKEKIEFVFVKNVDEVLKSAIIWSENEGIEKF
ncbi:MAG: endopeptidase La [Clostridia bacterium]|nr:endopeptidase La [Clostridia bacterium]